MRQKRAQKRKTSIKNWVFFDNVILIERPTKFTIKDKLVCCPHEPFVVGLQVLPKAKEKKDLQGRTSCTFRCHIPSNRKRKKTVCSKTSKMVALVVWFSFWFGPRSLSSAPERNAGAIVVPLPLNPASIETLPVKYTSGEFTSGQNLLPVSSLPVKNLLPVSSLPVKSTSASAVACDYWCLFLVKIAMQNWVLFAELAVVLKSLKIKEPAKFPGELCSCNKKQCSRQLQCEVPCRWCHRFFLVLLVFHKSCKHKSSFISANPTAAIWGGPGTGRSKGRGGPGAGGSGGGRGQGTFHPPCHILHNHMVLRPQWTSHNDWKVWSQWRKSIAFPIWSEAVQVTSPDRRRSKSESDQIPSLRPHPPFITTAKCRVKDFRVERGGAISVTASKKDYSPELTSLAQFWFQHNLAFLWVWWLHPWVGKFSHFASSMLHVTVETFASPRPLLNQHLRLQRLKKENSWCNQSDTSEKYLVRLQ